MATNSNTTIKEKKIFSEFFAKFLRSISNFERFEKTMRLITHVFPNLWTAKYVFK